MDYNETTYISSACNRSPNSLDWGQSTVCYAACNSVAIYDPAFAGSGKVLHTLHHHKSRVNCVKWIKHNDGFPETEFLSASSDYTAVVWSKNESGSYNPTTQLKGHKNIVTVLDGLYLDLESSRSEIPALVVATASVDATVKIWRRENACGDMSCIKTLYFTPGFCLSTRLGFLPGTAIPILACGTDDSKIYLFAESYEEENDEDDEAITVEVKHFSHVATLVGHEDWVKGLDFTKTDSGELLLASCSQDKLIRLWRISAVDDACNSHTRKRISELNIDEDIELEKQRFSIKYDVNEDELKHFTVFCESVLSGHEGWIYGINWCPPVYCNDFNKWTYPMKLLSSSMDKTIVLWEPDAHTGIWFESLRVGEVGGNTLGFYGAKFSSDGHSFIAHGFQGSFHLWKFHVDTKTWKAGVTVGGHFGEVSDLQWEPGGQFLLSVSTDQTARLHAPWIKTDRKQQTWHEIARPQVHGYDMSCLATISKYCFASGAEEKVIRVFQAPKNFLDNFHSICGINETVLDAVLPSGASVPALGLSNKAVFKDEEASSPVKKQAKNEYPEHHFMSLKLEAPPTEEDLIQNTLWPEIQKLYGHGYELYALASHPNGKLLASACKATNLEDAGILLWDTETWQQVGKLQSHQLTVTQLSFSPNGTMLLSVSRDRRWSLFREQTPGKYELTATTDKKTGIHTRIIWSCAWSPDSKYFATSSREGKVVVWEVTGASDAPLPLGPVTPHPRPLDLEGQSVTAVTFAPRVGANDSYLLAVGLEKGSIIVYLWTPNSEDCWIKYLDFENNLGHHLSVTRLCFRPNVGNTSDTVDESQNVLYLASCSDDHAVKIHRLLLKT